MLGYIPRAVQLKLFRYALSKLDFLDHSTYDVERDFNLSLGLRNELEMKNLGLNVTKLAATLNLPPNLRLHDARVSILHIRIPTDFHRTPVRVSISTVIVDGELINDTGNENFACGLKSDGSSAQDVMQDPDFGDRFKIPSGIDLTSSFLQERPAEAKEVDAVLQSKFESREAIGENDSEEEDPAEDSGLGMPLSFWNFVPSFFQRLVDRVEIVVEDISLRIKILCPPEPRGLDINYLTVTFSIDSIEIEGVAASTDDTKRNTPTSRTAKSGMRAIRIDGIALLLSGYPGFFEDLSSSRPPHLGDTDTVASGSTVLPSVAIPARSVAVKNPDVEGSQEIYLSESLPLGVRGPDTIHQHAGGSEDPRVAARSFLAHMQEPDRGHTRSPPSPPMDTSENMSFSPISSFHGSTGPEETTSGTISHSFFDPENNTGLSQSGRSPVAYNPEAIYGRDYQQNIEPIQGNATSHECGDNSDSDSLEGEPRHFDLFQEPNTKFLGVTATIPPRSASLSPDSRIRSRSPEPSSYGRPYSRIAEPVPRPAPAMTISQTLTNLELVNASPEPNEQYTYYEEPLDPIEYSNPDLLYLSRSIHSAASSTSNDETQHSADHESLEASKAISVSLSHVEPRVIYASSDKGGPSESGSVYESYPPSEADDAPISVQTNPQDNIDSFHPLQESEDEATTQVAGPSDSCPHGPSPDTCIQVQIRADGDQQKIPRDTAVLIQNRIPSPLISSQISTSPTEEADPQTLDAEESGSEESESALAESMIFTHEEAGSLYLSALGGSQSFDPSLPALVERNETPSPSPVLGMSIPRMKIQKRLFQIDYIDIFVPGIVQPTGGATEDQESEATPTFDSISESIYPNMPGAFSVYAAGRSERRKISNSLLASHSTRLNPKSSVSFKLMDEASPIPHRQRPQSNPRESPPGGCMELEIGNINISIDLIVGRNIVSILSTTGIIGRTRDFREVPEPEPVKIDNTVKDRTSVLALSVVSLGITLVDRMPEFIAPQECGEFDSGEPDLWTHQHSKTDHLNILVISVREVKLGHRLTKEQDALGFFSEVSLGSCSVKIGGQDVMKFIPNQNITTSGKQKAAVIEPSLIFRIEDNQMGRHIYFRSAVVNFYFPVQDLEATLAYFGGLDQILNTTPASSLSSKGRASQKASGMHATESQDKTPVEKQVSITADISGINIEVFISSVVGGVGLSTSPIKITTKETGGLAAKLSQLAIFGPNIGEGSHFGSAASVLESNSISVTFDNSPTEEDLERLLKMIMPSTDGYEDDDDNVMVDILLRQRRRGSVLRVNIGETKGSLSDLGDISQFRAIAEELAKMATVAKYIPQDERPGMLALISVGIVSFNVFPENEPSSFTVGSKNADICHVAAPSLFALSIGRVNLIRQPGKANEVWVGESLPHSLAVSDHKHKNRSMVMVRMIGDEPEPELKIKIWNTRVECHAKSLFELLSLTTKTTPDVAATSMVNSSTNLTKKWPSSQSINHDSSQDNISRSNQPPLRLNIGLRGVSLVLNPLDSTSKALFIIHDGTFVCGLSSHQPLSASLVLLKANLLAIDNRNNLSSPHIHSPDSRKQKHQPLEELYYYTSQGYVSVLTATSAKVNLNFDNDDVGGETSVLVNVEDTFIFVESCADSTQTVISILNGMKPPLPESEEIKYMTQIMPVDVFANLDEDAFMPVDAACIGGQPRNLKSLEEIPEDLFEDEIPFNSQLIESYYPYSDLPNADRSSVSSPSIPPRSASNFHEQVCVVAEEPLTFDDQYIQAPYKRPQGDQIKAVPRKIALKVCIRNTQLIWNLHDGYDWQKTRDTISKAVKKVEERAFRRHRRNADTQRGSEEDEDGNEDEDGDDEESETYDVLFNSIYITLPHHRDPKDLSKDIQNQIKGSYDLQSETGSYTPTVTTVDSPYNQGAKISQTRKREQKYQRSKRNAMQFELKGVDVDFTMFDPDGSEIQTSLDLRINEVQVTENVRTSTWRMFLTYMREAGVRERGLPMAHIHVDTLRPIPELAATELSIKVKLLPLRLYVDQDALEFLTRFFEFKDPDTPRSGVKQEEPFIQRCEIDTVRVKLDFKPKRVDYAGLRSGRTTEFMNFFILEEADMELRHVALNGVSGFERLGKDLNNIWMPDIKQNQLGGVVAGVAPFRSLVNIGTGVRDLVKVPIMEYRKDGRLVRSIKKGTQHFVKTSGSEVARLGAKLAIGTQTFLERTEEFLVGDLAQQRQHIHLREGFSGEEDENSSAAAFSPYADQPLGVYNGLVQARRGLTRNLNEAKEAILRVPSEAAQGGSAKGAAAAVFRAAPTAVIRPMIGVTEAVHKTLHGIDNTIDKEKREKTRDKYKKRSS
ncbi:autophagy- protein 2 [Orbilia oligospora]|uniref:Autophagy-related protein 2 n=1 Tax=Orbilia oligospora TaxID=2813651 RepID=A0A7C8Q785_ORBOL|nr:autophagy- protein 2 [Orbilia oligospora]